MTKGEAACLQTTTPLVQRGTKRSVGHKFFNSLVENVGTIQINRIDCFFVVVAQLTLEKQHKFLDGRTIKDMTDRQGGGG